MMPCEVVYLSDRLTYHAPSPDDDFSRAPGPRQLVIHTSFVIATRFGGETLRKCLEATVREMDGSRERCEIVLVADGASDDDLAGIRDIAPALRLLRHVRPLGVATAYNRGFKAATGEIAALLNDDMFVEPGFLGAALAELENPRVFATTAHLIEAGTGAICCGRNAMTWQDGQLAIDAHREAETTHAFYATGGGCFRRRLFLSLGGFSRLYAPFYWEDVHVSYQAWTRGYEIHYARDSRVVHDHRATVNRVISRENLERVMNRNQWLFAWSSLTSPAFTRRLIAAGIETGLSGIRGGDAGRARSYLDAHGRLPEALSIRRATARNRSVSDEEIWEKVGIS